MPRIPRHSSRASDLAAPHPDHTDRRHNPVGALGMALAVLGVLGWLVHQATHFS